MRGHSYIWPRALFLLVTPLLALLLPLAQLVQAQAGWPVLDLNGDLPGAGYSTTFSEDAGPHPAVSATGLTVTDSDSANLLSAMIILTNRPDGELESLAVNTGATGISGSYNSMNGRLTLNGTAPVAAYQEVLRTLTYQNISQSPDSADRNVTLVVDDGPHTSAVVTSTVAIHAVNDAPILDSSGNMAMVAINEDDVNSAGNAVGTIIQSAETGGEDRITDVDKVALEGFAVIEAASTNGTWQYSTNGGGSWAPFEAVSNNSAVLLNTAARIRFVPNPNFSGAVNFTFRAWDQTQGQNGDSGVDVTGNGNTTAFSTATETVALNVLTVNDLPVVDLDGATEGLDFKTSFAPGGAPEPVAASSATITDQDSTSLTRIVMTLTNPLDGAAEMLVVGTLPPGITSEPYNPASGVLTLNGPDTLSNFQLALRQVAYNSTLLNPASGIRIILVVANDGTGDSQPVSSIVAVNLANTAPTLNAAGAYQLTNVAEDTLEPPGDTVQAMIASVGGDPITDPDPGAQEGIAVTGVDDTNGRWQYKTAAIWLNFGAISDTAAVLLNGAARVRFVPNANYHGSAGALTFRAWDLITHANGQRDVDASRNGGSTAFSSASATATLTVTPVNEPPAVVIIGGAVPTYTEDEPAEPLINGTLTLSDVDSALLASATLTLVNLLDPGAEWLVATTGGTNIIANYDANSGVLQLTGQATPANYAAVIKSVAYRNSSQDPTATERTVQLIVSDGTLTSMPIALGMRVTPLNDPPMIDLNGAGPGTGYVANFTASWGAVGIVDQNLSVADVDNTTLAGAVIMIVNPVNGSAEQLTADISATPNISKVYDPDAHELRLTGTDSAANYQQVLRTVKYNNLLSDPHLADRQITFVLNDGAAVSASAISTVHLRETPVSHLYLPVIAPPRSDEPNDSCPQAYGLDIGRSYAFLPDDRDDWYYFDLPATAEVTVELTNFTPVEGQIIVASGTAVCQGLQLVGSNGNHQAEKIVVLGSLPDEHYFIWIITDGPFNNTTPYNLLIHTE
jgi:hypothetical protein